MRELINLKLSLKLNNWDVKGSISILFLLFSIQMIAQPLAFKGAEGHGAYTTGGRGGAVIEVTNLNDSGAGSLRKAIEASGPRTIVFRVSGTIQLQKKLTIKNGDLTIAGQTAPGEGICLRDYTLTVDADNVIIRFIRCRLGDEQNQEDDAMNGRFHKNIIIDHCSMSWSVDEVASFYSNENFTMQWCIISESLYKSVHDKGNHGYGGIWGGMPASFHHNLLAHHTSRNPRFNGGRSGYGSTPETEVVDFRNNVIYNWGNNSAYAGEFGSQNMVNNYYKAGPATHKRKNRIIEPWETGKWFIEGNYVHGFPAITADNWAGGVQPKGGTSLSLLRVDEALPTGPIETQTAEEAYVDVLNYAGCILPVRDAIDARIVEETRTGTATYGASYGSGEGIIDTPGDVGGWIELTAEPAPEDNDHDGMADLWEDENGLDKTDPTDRNVLLADGTTFLEVYLNSLAEPEVIEEPEPEPGVGVTDLAVSDITVFPNPVKNIVNVRYSLEKDSEVEMSVINMSGRVMKNTQTENQFKGLNHSRIDVEGLQNGIYFLKINTKYKVTNKKIIISN